MNSLALIVGLVLMINGFAPTHQHLFHYIISFVGVVLVTFWARSVE